MGDRINILTLKTSINPGKIMLFVILAILHFTLFANTETPGKPKGVKTIVIDPGHGGKDPGCNGVTHKEKDIALAIGLKLGKLIEQNLKDVKVIYTRTTDVFVELEERAQIANRNNADLFISIHCNAAGKFVTVKDKNGKIRYKTYKDKKGNIRKVEVPNPRPFGSATYVMGISNEKGKMNVAKRENAAMLLEDNYEKNYNGFDPESDEAYIIMSMWTGAFVEKSADLASKIQKEYSEKAGRIDKGVQRQSIWVLWRTAMPSILTEVGFLTNPEEEIFLASEKGQHYMASALFRAVRKYKDQEEGTQKKYEDEFEKQEPLMNENILKGNSQYYPKDDEPVVEEDSLEAENNKKNQKYQIWVDSAGVFYKDKKYQEALAYYKKASEIKPEEKLPVVRIEELNKLLKNVTPPEPEKDQKNAEWQKKYDELIAKADALYNQKKWDESRTQYVEAAELMPHQTYPKQRIKEITLILQKEKTAQVKDTVKSPPQTGIVDFRVQFGVAESEPDIHSEKYAKLDAVDFYMAGKSYKLTSGHFTNPDEAVKHQTKVRNLGYKDAFVVAFQNGQRIDYKEAVKLVGKQ